MVRHNRIAISALVLLLAGCTENSLGTEYREISEEESNLQFYAPGLEGGYRKILHGQDEQFVTRTAAVYGPRRGEYPHGQLVLIDLPPGRHFTRVDPPQDHLEEWGTFKERKIRLGPGGTAVNAIGSIDYAVFQADNISCVIFKQVFGAIRESGFGTRQLAGYYCKGEAPMMTKGEAVSIVGAVGHRKFGAVEPPPGWTETASLSIQLIWGDNETGIEKFDGWIRLPSDKKDGTMGTVTGAGRNCSGVVSYDRSTKDTVFMLWSIRCDDNTTASGSLRARKPDDGKAYLFGEGEDSKGRNIAIID